MSTKTIAQMSDAELAEYMGQDATTDDAAIMRELLRDAALTDDTMNKIDDTEWSRLLALIPAKREANECEDTFRKLASQPDRGIIDADHAAIRKQTCERYVQLCDMLGDTPCVNYARVARRVEVVLDDEMASRWTCPECGASNVFDAMEPECTECGCTNPDCV